jgi:hypothetical protein
MNIIIIDNIHGRRVEGKKAKRLHACTVYGQGHSTLFDDEPQVLVLYLRERKQQDTLFFCGEWTGNKLDRL